MYCKELNVEKSVKYELNIIKQLSKELTDIYGKGFTKANLYFFYSFYKYFPEIFCSVIGKSSYLLSWIHCYCLVGLKRIRLIRRNNIFSEGVQMKDQTIINQLIEYIKEERYNQAVLIDGDWGSGKTYFVKEKLIKALEQANLKKKVYYISLYGISSTEEIMSEIYSSVFWEVFDNKFGEKNGENIQKGASFISKLVATGMKYFNINTSELPSLSDIQKIKKAIIIFDDLERCEIEINKTLGFINNLVEHNDVRVILIANQKEIGKMNLSKDMPTKMQVALNERLVFNEKDLNKKEECDGYTKEQLSNRIERLFAKDDLYEKVKEKLIGLTVLYKPEFQDVFVSIVSKFVNNNDAQKYLLDKKRIIIDLFEDKKHYNIRILIFALIAFEKMYAVINKIKFDPHEYIDNQIENILKYIIVSAIQIKSGIAPCNWRNNLSETGIVYYDSQNIIGTSIYGYRFVDDYLLYCKFDRDKIIEVINNVVNDKKKNDESKHLEESLQYKKLYEWWKLDDEEIEETLPNILEELKLLKYSPRYFRIL